MDIAFEYAKAIPGTVLGGMMGDGRRWAMLRSHQTAMATSGVVKVDGEIVADFIELEPGLFYADDAHAGMTNHETWKDPWKENGREITGSKAEVIEFFIGE